MCAAIPPNSKAGCSLDARMLSLPMLASRQVLVRMAGAICWSRGCLAAGSEGSHDHKLKRSPFFLLNAIDSWSDVGPVNHRRRSLRRPKHLSLYSIHSKAGPSLAWTEDSSSTSNSHVHLHLPRRSTLLLFEDPAQVWRRQEDRLHRRRLRLGTSLPLPSPPPLGG